VLGELVREGRIGLELRPGLMARVALGVYVMPQAHERGQFDRGFHSPIEPRFDEEDADEPTLAGRG